MEVGEAPGVGGSRSTVPALVSQGGEGAGAAWKEFEQEQEPEQEQEQGQEQEQEQKKNQEQSQEMGDEGIHSQTGPLIRPVDAGQ